MPEFLYFQQVHRIKQCYGKESALKFYNFFEVIIVRLILLKYLEYMISKPIPDEPAPETYNVYWKTPSQNTERIRNIFFLNLIAVEFSGVVAFLISCPLVSDRKKSNAVVFLQNSLLQKVYGNTKHLSNIHSNKANSSNKLKDSDHSWTCYENELLQLAKAHRYTLKLTKLQ